MKRGRQEKQKSIVTQTVLRVSVVFVMALILFTVLFTAYIGVYMKDNLLESRRRQVETVAQAMEAGIGRMAEPMILLAEYEYTSKLLTGYYDIYSAEWMNSVRNMDAYLQNVNMFTDYVIDINLLDAQAKGVYSMRDVLSLDHPYGEQDWFREALEKDGLVKYAPPHGTDHLYQKNIRTTFSMIYPVEYAGRLSGYIVMECDLYRIADFLGSGEPGAGYMLLDDAGRTIHSDAGEREPQEEIVDYGGIMAGETRIVEDRLTLYVAHRLKTNGWIVVLEVEKELMLFPIRRLFLLIGCIVAVTAVVLLIVTVYHIKTMEKPFNALIERIKSYDGSGAEYVPGYDNAPKELAVIRDQFEHMAEKMNGLIQDVYVARLKQKESELEALTNQLNPHFLYNVFQTIQTRAVLDDNREIEEMIQALSMMMRYTMERKRELVRIADEIAYIKNYLMFYKIRFPRLFTYTIQCPEDILECRTIKFILQPVVENCFKHAFSDRTSGGLISITASQEGQDIIFEITDNGCGIAGERLLMLKNQLKQPSAEGGIGILNTNARLRLIYGSDYGVELESAAGESVRVTVRIRKERE